MPDSDVLIHASGLTKRFGDFTAVDGIDFELHRGEAFGFLGPERRGQVVHHADDRLRLAADQRRADHPRAWTRWRQGPAIRARLGVVPQEDTLDVELTVRENLLIYGRYFGLPRDVIAERTARLLEFVQLTDRAGDQVEPLSGGMKRRLTIARSLINEPEILLLDEPTTGLDPQARHVVWDRLFRLKQQGVTLVLTTHYMDEAEQLCDRLVVMDGGRIAAEGSPRELIGPVLHARGAGAAVPAVRARSGGGEAGRRARPSGCEVLADRVLLYVADGDAARWPPRGRAGWSR